MSEVADFYAQQGASLIADLDGVAADIFRRWGRDMRSGKLLTALEGRISNYDPRVTRIREALDAKAAQP